MTRVAWRIGKMSPGKCRPQSHSGRSAMEVRVRPRFHADPPMEFTSTSDRTRSGLSWAKRTATPPPKEWPTTTTFSSTPTARRKPSRKRAYPPSVNSLAGSSGVPAKPGERRGVHEAALGGDALDHRPVGVVPERPAVEQHDGHALPGEAVERRAIADPRPLPHHGCGANTTCGCWLLGAAAVALGVRVNVARASPNWPSRGRCVTRG